jgi:methylmalonyl-CoA epimerase
MNIIGIEHVGIAVDDLEETSSFWGDILRIVHTHTESVETESVNTKIYDTGKGKIELLDSLDETSPVQKFIQKRGPGVHHICLEVEDINIAIKELKESGIEVLSDFPRVGAEGYKIVFIHPKSTGGVLVELAEKPA